MTENSLNKKLALGFIGVGWIGRSRMQALIEDGNIQATVIAEPCQNNASKALELAKDAALVQSPEEVYSFNHLDGVVIATPSAMHAYQSMQALNAGKAVFCQKPLGRSYAEVKQVVEASKRADKLLSVDLSYRYTNAFKALYQTINSGAIGHVYAVNLVFHNAYGPDKPWFYDLKQSGGGCVIDLGVHMLDMALHCLNFPEISHLQSHLYCKGLKLKSNEDEVEDFAKIFMLTENNAAINLECSWHVSAGQDAIIEATFYGTEGGASLKNVNGSFYDFKAEKYTGTQTDTLVLPPDEWSGRTGLAWADKLASGQGFDSISADEYLKTALIIDRIYER